MPTPTLFFLLYLGDWCVVLLCMHLLTIPPNNLDTPTLNTPTPIIPLSLTTSLHLHICLCFLYLGDWCVVLLCMHLPTGIYGVSEEPTPLHGDRGKRRCVLDDDDVMTTA